MIDRIRLPAQEWLGYDPERGDIHGYTPEQMREFAELVIKECLDVGVKSGILDNDWNYPRYSKAIKEHFGVEV